MFSACMRFVASAAAAVLVGGSAVGQALMASSAATGGWASPDVLARHGVATDVAVAANGDMAVAVSDEGDVKLVLRSAGGDWGEPTTLVTSGHAEDARAAYDATGRLWVAWIDNHADPKVLVRHSQPGDGWSLTQVIATRAGGRFTGLQLELAAPHRAVVGWRWINLPRLGNG